MKSANIPALRVTPDLRRAAEDVLLEGETLSGFVEASLRAQIEQRREQREFIARGLAARDEAKASGQYLSKAQVMRSLKRVLKQEQQRAR